ncbi:trehalose 6-phosphate synthase [Tistlia consotensis]|uniref:Trehalose 6-phosphate synthase n=1 Tax=Tistlia consotensis USBA 355 TaxID=560819 RepID=A0A1Y6BCD3_9PROT|nr:trehalose-6-phosphate synthase [Tistlia consotensis]SMF03590.1 trehalose 6-phosphate synthase [Tistlia consotensis USBA 355]SNR53884.1 trehalose 6-phosphate synthase [Tistlia consotensis]
MRRLVVVSNRVAPSSGADSAGGLSVGLHAALKRSQGLWIGWNGRIEDSAREELQVEDGEAYQLATRSLSQAEHDRYYAGFSNGALWPLLHGRSDLMRFDPEDLPYYLAVNERFARQAVPLLSSADLLWVHDYHFLALGDALRRRNAHQPLGFFLHVPFPHADCVAALPCHHQVMRLLSAYDLIGFQTEASLRNFRDYVVRHHGALAEPDHVTLAGRRVRVGRFPIGIDVDRFAALATSARVQQLVGELLPCFSSAAGIVGVDRLDYTKGLPQRLRAFERFLEQSPQWRRRAFLTQVAAPSREDVQEYADLRHDLDTLSGRINARHASVDWMPLRYINRALPQWRLAALYRLSRVGLVTPLADGMNLVAKEYLAAQDPADPGVLVLSRFAGAADQLGSALLVNPHDFGAVAAAIRQALEMPLEERRSRWASAIAGLRAQDVHDWRERFLVALAQNPEPPLVRLARAATAGAGPMVAPFGAAGGSVLPASGTAS